MGDHVSHIGSTLLFLDKGFRVFSHTQRELCDRPLAPGEAEAAYARVHFPHFAPSDWCGIHTTDRAFHVNWIHIVKPYPLGLYLYTLPEAGLFLAGVREHALVTLSLCKYLLAALLLCWVLARLYVGTQVGPGPPVVRFAVWLVVSAAVLHWTLHGVYDGIAILAACWAVSLADQDRDMESWTCMTLAIFLHYRMLLFLPLMLFLSWRAARLCFAQPAPWPRRAWFFAILALNLLNAGIFVQQLSAIGALPDNSPLRHSRVIWVFLATLLPWALMSLRRRHYLWAATIAWSALFLYSTRQMMPWHWMSLLPLLAIARMRPHGQLEFVGVHGYLLMAFGLLYRVYPADLLGVFAM